MTLQVMRTLPEWLTEDYIADVLCSGQKSSLPVKIIDVTYASEDGDNYLGSLYRITVESKSTHKSIIVKIMANKNQGCKFISSFGLFEREINIYHKVLPQLYSVMKKQLGDVEYFSPYCYPTSRTDTIILEDLRPLGYKIADRKEQLDMDHAFLVLRVLAKIHAFSYIMGTENIQHYHDIFYSRENRHLSAGFLKSIFKSLCRTVSKWKGYEKYASLLWQFSESVVDQFNEAVRPVEGSFCVLNHGDCWTNNLLFRYCAESGKLLDVKFVDYQQARYASPVLDLIFFFYSSLRLEVWKQQDKLLRYYHKELMRWLSSAGVNANVYTFQDLENDMNEKLTFALLSMTTVLAVALVDPGDGPDLEKLLYENDDSQISQFEKSHNDPKFRENVQVFLQHFEKEGLFRS